MSKLRRSFVAVAALVPLALAVIWLAPFAAGEDDSYDDSTRTVTIKIKKKDKHKPAPRPKPALDQCTGIGAANGKDGVKCPHSPGGEQLPAQEIEDAVRQAVAQLQLPANTPVFGPSPNQNQWGMVPVGYPVWLWSADATTTLHRSVTHDGISIDLTASRSNVSFSMGDGHTVTCTAFTKRPSPMTGDPMRGSPNCGYVYSVMGRYKIQATTNWTIRWTADGRSGALSVTNTIAAASPIVVGELRTVITGGR